MAIILNSGRAAMASSIKNEIIHLAFGTGDPSWNAEKQTEDKSQTSLITEIGRRIVDSVSYCIGDADGEVVTSMGRFSISETPTNNLLFKVQGDYSDSGTSIIREYGIFVGTKVLESCPIGQRYFLPSEIEDPGILFGLENTLPIYRSPSTREMLSFVITF